MNLKEHTILFIEQVLKKNKAEINAIILEKTGIIDFVNLEKEILDFKLIIDSKDVNPNTVEYGDFQTPSSLTDSICQKLTLSNCSPSVVFEPTCGRGNFLLSAIKKFSSCTKFVGSEIYKPYLNEAKLIVLDYMLNEHSGKLPKIYFYHQSIFDFDYENVFKKEEGKILILGNPPWVTNSVLGSLESKNLPTKSNIKNLNGFDALTGKSNFDISEFILIQLLKTFQNFDGYISFLVKNSVVKNIVNEQKKTAFNIGNIQMQRIDAKKEFNVSVEASNLFCTLNSFSEKICLDIDLYTGEEGCSFGWFDNKFVSNIEGYKQANYFDGKSSLVWRSGMKHDCTRVFELTREEGLYQNKLKEKFELEDELVYTFLKSSDLKGGIINKSRKFVIATQKKIGESTKHIQKQYPKTYAYLKSHEEIINKRASIIYKGKPQFSIFGIGDYSYKPFKVAISGLYKRSTFSLITTDENNKAILLDDTCYLLSFEEKINAYLVYKMLNSEQVQTFLKSIVFIDAKRAYNKDTLMRLSLSSIHDTLNFENFDFSDASILNLEITKKDWCDLPNAFGKKTAQKLLFE